MRTLGVALLCLATTGAAAVKECKIDGKHFVTNTPQNISKILRMAPADTFQTGYTYKEFEFGLRLYLLQPPEVRKKIYADLLEAALKTRSPFAFGGEPLFSLILRDPLARDLWEKRDPKAKPEERYQQLTEQLKKLPAPYLTLPEVEKLFSAKPKNGTAFLTSLPKDYRKNYAVMFESGASQESTESDPRAIFFSPDIVVGFNGNSEHHRFENVEVMHLNPNTATTDLYETEPTDDKSHVRLSSRNPGLCTNCHGPTSEPYAKWMSYNFWKGAVAGLEDVLRGETSREGKSLSKLLAKAETHERYKLLENLKTYFGNDKDLAKAHNGHLNRLLNLHSMVRMLRLMAATPSFCKYRYAVLGAVAGCKDIQSFIPERLRNKEFSSFDAIAANTKTLGEKLKEEFNKAYPHPGEQLSPTEFFEEASIANLRYLFEGRGISMQGWSTDHFTGYGWNDGTYKLEDFATLLRYAYEDLYENYPPHKFGAQAPNDCAWFKEQSLSELKSLAPLEIEEKSTTQKTTHP